MEAGLLIQTSRSKPLVSSLPILEARIGRLAFGQHRPGLEILQWRIAEL